MISPKSAYTGMQNFQKVNINISKNKETTKHDTFEK